MDSNDVAMATGNDDELVATQQRLKKVTEEMEKLREDMIILQSRGGGVRYALDFDPGVFIKMKFTESLRWVTATLSPKMKERMSKFPEYFRMVQLIGNTDDVAGKACAGYNRGSPCRAKWHTYSRHQNTYMGVEELRLHCCALCLDALQIISGHPLVECPWINESTWSIIQA